MHNHSYDNEFNLQENEILFSYERMSTKTHFESLETLERLLFFALFTNNYYCIKLHYKENKNISKINYRSSEKNMCAVTKVA